MDLNQMMREQARAGLQTRLDKAVTDGDTAEATKISNEIAALAVATAPKPSTSYGDAEVRAELDKQPWFGVDPKKSGRVLELGKHMDPKKFANAAAFAEALVKAVDEEFKPAAAAGNDDGGDDNDADDEGGEDEKPAPKPKRTDGPREGEGGPSGTRRAASGPWTKLSDAPADIQKEIKRQADKFVSSTAPKEQREKFINNALASHYNAHQQKAKAGKR